MTKSRSNALDALRGLIAQRQQFDQWISTLESKRDGTAEHVFNRVYADYRTRLERVLDEIRSPAEELQLSINSVSERLAEVGREEGAKRDALQEAELRATVGEYDQEQWESLRTDANRQLEKIAGDRGTLEEQLSELESIRKLSQVTAPPPESAPTAIHTTEAASTGASPQPVVETPEPPPRAQPAHTIQAPGEAGWPTRDIPPHARASVPAAARQVTQAAPEAGASKAALAEQKASPASGPRPNAAESRAQQSRGLAEPNEPSPAGSSVPPGGASDAATPSYSANLDSAVAAPRPSASPVAPPPAPAPPTRRKRDTPGGKDAQGASSLSRPVSSPPDSRPEVNKTLKCPECGTPNYPTEWYCERCGGELATM